MDRRPNIASLTFLAASLALMPLAPSGEVSAQEAEGRWRVLVPDFQPTDGADRRFGQRTAERVQGLIDRLNTHQPIGSREYRDALRQFDLRRENVDCISARQLAPQINARLVICGEYADAGDGNMRMKTTVWTVPGQESFDISETVIPQRNGEDAAAAHVNSEFGAFVEQTRLAQFCLQYHESQQWDSSLSNCDRALELNPESQSVRFVRGRTLLEMSRYDEALGEFEWIVERNPIHEGALQNAGWVSAQLGKNDEALRYYREYLELNPDNSRIRMQVAFTLATEGDSPEAAVVLLQEGVERDPENVDMWERLGGAAFLSASRLSASDNGASQPEVRRMYETAVNAYTKVLEARGEETDASALANSIRAYVQLEEFDRAVQLGRQILEQKRDAPQIWEAQATALQRSGNIPEAIAALDEAGRLDADRRNYALRAQWLVQVGDVDAAIPFMKQAVEAGEQPADQMANLLFGRAYNEGVRDERDLAMGIRVLTAAKELPVGDGMKAQLDFWHGYALFLQGRRDEAPQTVASAQANLPVFRQALQLLQASRAYTQQPGAPISAAQHQNIIEAAEQYIDIQDAIIRRGR